MAVCVIPTGCPGSSPGSWPRRPGRSGTPCRRQSGRTDLRHTHATLYLRAGVHPKIVSERLGHATISITLDVYQHALPTLPTLQREAAAQVAALIYGA
jgi:integrase